MDECIPVLAEALENVVEVNETCAGMTERWKREEGEGKYQHQFRENIKDGMSIFTKKTASTNTLNM